MSNTFALNKKRYCNICLGREWHHVGVVGDKIVECLWDEEHFVVAHVCTRASVSVKFGLFHGVLGAVQCAVVEGSSH